MEKIVLTNNERIGYEWIKRNEQLRILKNYIMQDSTITKTEIINLINAMEANDE